MTQPQEAKSRKDSTAATPTNGDTGPPDWKRIDFDPQCPRCGYNLRGLDRARCPECGLTFDWAVLIQRHVDRSMFLFEQGWRRRPILSFAETLWRTLSPWKFWRTVRLEEPICAPALLVLAISALLGFLLMLHGAAVSAAIVVRIGNYFAGNPWPYPFWYWSHPSLFQLDMLGRWPVAGDWRYALLPLGLASWSIGIALILGVCQQTLGRCRVRRLQIMRVVVYSLPPVYLWLIAVFHLAALSLPRRMFFGLVPIALMDRELMRLGPVESFVGLFCVVSTLGLQAMCLILALDRYLKLDRPRRVGLVATLVAALFSYTTVVWISVAVAG